MSTLVFRALDRHVVGGLADHAAIEDDRGPMSYAQLLHESACVAGTIGHTGVEQGTEVSIEVPPGRELVIAVLACTRLGAVPRPRGSFRFVGTPPVFHTPDTEVPWDLLVRAGRTEPAQAPSSDPDGYEELMLQEFGEVFSVLLAGGTI